MLPVFPIRLILIALPVVLVAALLAAAFAKGGRGLKNQGVAWVITALMVVAAVFIGIGRSPLNNPRPESVPAPRPDYPDLPSSSVSFVWDNARVLSDRTVRELDARNEKLWEYHNVSIGVVTCNYGGDLYDYAMQCAEDMELGGYDMIVVLDISGDNYWLLQGSDIRKDFTDNDCSDYAYDYMEDFFARGDYDNAVLRLTEMLEAWYGTYYG